MAGHTLVAVYDTQARAHEAREALITSGIDTSDIRLSSEGATGSVIDGTAGQTRHKDSSEEMGFFDWLFSSGVSETDRERYRSRLDGERTAVSVYMDGDNSHAAAEILERFDPIDVHEDSGTGDMGSSASRGSEVSTTAGMTGTTQSATTSVPSMAGDGTAGGTMSGSSTTHRDSIGRDTARGSDDQVIPIVREDLNVGKRVEERRQRIRTYAVERPVERDVHLRDERVVVERRPVTDAGARAAEPGALQGREFEVVERHEVPVVGKEARVVEEVVVHKEAQDRVEKVQDTVRETEVDVEGAPALDRSSEHMGSDSGSGAESPDLPRRRRTKSDVT